MTFMMIIRTLLEIIMVFAVIWAIFHEDRLAAFEQRLLCRFRRKRLRVVKNYDHTIYSEGRA